MHIRMLEIPKALPRQISLRLFKEPHCNIFLGNLEYEFEYLR